MSNLLYRPVTNSFPAESIPHVIIETHPEYERFYEFAWNLAWNHVCESTHLPYSPYLSEGCNSNRIWIWDSCFMAMFCRYANDVFPGENTLDNLYKIHSDSTVSPLPIHHLDNPPLFAWAEWQYFSITGDHDRLHKVLPFLVHYFNWLENIDPEQEIKRDNLPSIAWKFDGDGYRWRGCPSGMDNTPRGRGDYSKIWWVDALAQQALSALYICKIAVEINRGDIFREFQQKYQSKKHLLSHYWDEQTGAFVDLNRADGSFCRVLTPASFWPLLADCATHEQAIRQAQLLLDPQKLGGFMPFPSVSRDDIAFDPLGGYWSGGVWLPVAYMGIKSLENYGLNKIADRLALNILNVMEKTWENYNPHSIWECYSPTEFKPSTNKKAEICRKDFCGWSALGPICLLIENVIGVDKLSAQNQSINWNPRIKDGKIGIKKLKLGKNIVDLLTNHKTLNVNTLMPLNLHYLGKSFYCQPGENCFVL